MSPLADFKAARSRFLVEPVGAGLRISDPLVPHVSVTVSDRRGEAYLLPFFRPEWMKAMAAHNGRIDPRAVLKV
jgi:hypothetical protein